MDTLPGFKKLSIAMFTAVLTATGLQLVDGASTVAKAAPGPTECYRVGTRDLPTAAEHPASAGDVWCYRDLEDPAGARLVYQIDGAGRMRPELSIMVEPDGTLRHASRNKGKLTVHRLESGDFNPIGAPLVPPEGAEPVPAPISTASADSFDEGIRILQEHGDIVVRAARMSEGTVTVTVPPESMPWRSYWFPYSSGRMHKGENSPMAKYDKFVARRAAGAHLGAQAWESKNHVGRGWFGHCNGWAAASIMEPEPVKPITDPITFITFTPSDQKALLLSRHYCPKLVFYGSRNMGRPGDDPMDIYPGTFHNVLSYFLGELKKPVLMDYMATRPVENSVVSGYTMKSRKTGPNSYYVETTLTVHLYDKALTEEVGVARSFKKTYRYTLATDAAGNVRSGRWMSKNPDFLWVPLAPGECDYRNNAVEGFWIEQIRRFARQ